MITKEEFTKYIDAYREFEAAIERLEKLISGRNRCYFIYETDWCEAVGKMLDGFLDSHFTESGIDWIFYYLFEDVDDKAAYVTEEGDMFKDPEEVRYPLTTLDELWDFLLTDKKLYFKNV